MRYISERQYEKQLRKINRENESLRRLDNLEKERNRFKKPVKKFSTSKLVLWAMMILIVQMVIFTEVVMWNTKDLSALYVLIGIPASMALPLWKYYSKSEAENTRGGIVYDTAMKQMIPTPIDDEDIVTLNDESGDDYFKEDDNELG